MPTFDSTHSSSIHGTSPDHRWRQMVLEEIDALHIGHTKLTKIARIALSCDGAMPSIASLRLLSGVQRGMGREIRMLVYYILILRVFARSNQGTSIEKCVAETGSSLRTYRRARKVFLKEAIEPAVAPERIVERIVGMVKV